MEREHDGTVGCGLRSQTGAEQGNRERQANLFRERLAQRLKQTIVRGRQATTDHHHGGVNGEQEGGDAASELGDEVVDLGDSVGIPLGRAGKHRLGVLGATPGELASLGDQAREGQSADISGGVVDAAARPSPQNQTQSNSVTDRQVEHIIHELRDTEVMLGEGGKAHPVVDRNGAVEAGSELSADVDT